MQQVRTSLCLVIILCQLLLFLGSSFTCPRYSVLASRIPIIDDRHRSPLLSSSSSSSSPSSGSSSNTDVAAYSSTDSTDVIDSDKNESYVNGLLQNLSQLLDKYIITGAATTRTSIYNILKQVEREAHDDEQVSKAKRMIKRAGLPLPDDDSNSKELGKTDADKRREEADKRKDFEASRTSTSDVGKKVSERASGSSRSALSQRTNANGKPDLMLQNMDRRLDPRSVSEDKAELERMMLDGEVRHEDIAEAREAVRMKESNISASKRLSEIIAKAGSANAFEGERLGIGGLDDVLSQVKRRVWTPLAVPPQLLSELGIHPVRGLLLYGRPGCGKTLMARTIGEILSPARPITVVAGPAIMDKFVGSSEKNLREIFDNPPDIYEKYRLGEPDGGDSVAANALHVVIMDEFDAIARTRGGKGGSQGDAGVARDSLVNQMLACLDGIEPPVVPTFVIGLTNKRSLIDPALLRPGRFEVQLEVPPPRTNEQRISILKVHTKNMREAGRLLVKDAPEGSAAARYVQNAGSHGIPTYEELLRDLAVECDGMSGASLAGVARAAASHALERVVEEYTTAVAAGADSSASMMDCLVTREDFDSAIQDVNESAGDTDWELTAAEKEEEDKNAGSESSETDGAESEDNS